MVLCYSAATVSRNKLIPTRNSDSKFNMFSPMESIKERRYRVIRTYFESMLFTRAIGIVQAGIVNEGKDMQRPAIILNESGGSLLGKFTNDREFRSR